MITNTSAVDPNRGVRPPGPADPAIPRCESVRSVARALELLDTLGKVGGEASLVDIASISRLPPSSVHRLLQTCINYGYIRQTSTHRYALGSQLLALGNAAGHQVGQTAQPRLRELVVQLGESASLAIKDGDQVVYVAEHPCEHAMRMSTEIGRRASLHATGAGKAILSTLSDAEIRVIITRTGMPAQTPRTLRTISALLADVDRIRSRGYAIDDEEQELDARSYAVAIPQAPTPMALSVSAPLARLTEAFAGQAVQTLHRTATQIGVDLQA